MVEIYLPRRISVKTSKALDSFLFIISKNNAEFISLIGGKNSIKLKIHAFPPAITESGNLIQPLIRHLKTVCDVEVINLSTSNAVRAWI